MRPSQSPLAFPCPSARAHAPNGQLPNCWILRHWRIQTLNRLHHHSPPPHANPPPESAGSVEVTLDGSSLPRTALTVLPRPLLQPHHLCTCSSQRIPPMHRTPQPKSPKPTPCYHRQTCRMRASCQLPRQLQLGLSGQKGWSMGRRCVGDSRPSGGQQHKCKPHGVPRSQHPLHRQHGQLLQQPQEPQGLAPHTLHGPSM